VENFLLQELLLADLRQKLQKSQKFEPAKILGHTLSGPLGKTFYIHTCTYKDAKKGEKQK